MVQIGTTYINIMIFILESKKEVLVNDAKSINAKLRFSLLGWYRLGSEYLAEFRYSYLIDEQEVTIKDLGSQRKMTDKEVNTLAALITPSATDYTEREKEFLVLGSKGILSKDGYFGLKGEDYELL